MTNLNTSKNVNAWPTRISSTARTAPRPPLWRLLVLIFAFCVIATLSAEEVKRPPNVIILMADDLGWSDLGAYGGEIKTPNLDALARDGLRYTQFYNTGRCWPTRASILTGYYAQESISRERIN